MNKSITERLKGIIMYLIVIGNYEAAFNEIACFKKLEEKGIFDEQDEETE